MATRKRADIEREVQDSLALFQRAQVGELAALEPRRARRVLGVVDGSSQDELTLALLGWLGRSLEAGCWLLDAREGAESEDLALERAPELGAESLARGEGQSFEQILAAAAAMEADLVVAPSPYGRDLDTVGADSTGTVVDVLLARLALPLLVVRRPFELPREGPRRAAVVVARAGEAAREAACWAVGLMRPGSTLELRLALEPGFLDELRALLDRAEPARQPTASSLEGALAARHAALHRGLQLLTAREGLSYELSVACDVRMPEAPGRELVVVALDHHDPSARGRVLDRIRQAVEPVLVVPWGVRSER